MSKRESLDAEVSVKKKRKRTAFSHVQQSKLENAFQKDHWPTRNKKERLAVELDMSLRSVRTWFQNRRAKEKREEDFKEMQAAKDKSIAKKPPHLKNIAPLKKPNKTEPPSIKMATTGSPGHMFSPSHTFVTRSKSKKQVRVKELQQSDTARSMTSGSDASERTSEEEEDLSTADEEDDVEEEDDAEEAVGVDKSSTGTEQSDSCQEDNTNNTNNTAAEKCGPKRRYVQSCQSEGDLVIAKHTARITADMFTTLIDMMAVTEGGLIKPNDPAFNGATNNALYGIQLKAGETLLYDKANGFYFENDN